MKLVAVFVALLALLPYAAHYAFRRQFVVHPAGVVLISGASTGIGKHAALALDQLGYTVFAGVRSEKAAALLSSASASLRPVVLDVTQPDTIAATLQIIQQYLDQTKQPFVGLVNNAGVSVKMPLEIVSVDTMQWLYDVNVFGVVRLTQAFLPHIRASSGRVVNIGSLAGLVSSPMDGLYSSSKFALESLTDAMRRELADFGVHAAVVEPGYVDTPIGDKALDDFKDLAPDKYKLYAAAIDAYPAKRRKNFQHAPSPEVTSVAIVDALTNPFPLTRYPCASAGGFPGKVLAWVVWALPDYMADRVLF